MYWCAKIKRIFDGTLVAVIIADDSDSCARVGEELFQYDQGNVVIVGAVIPWY